MIMPEDRSTERFIRKGSRFMIWDNATKVLDPLLVFTCAGLYAGGDWGTFKYYESLMILLMRFSILGLDKGIIWIYSRAKEPGAFIKEFSRCINITFILSLVFCTGILLYHWGYLPLQWSRLKAPIQISPLYLGLFLASVPLQIMTLLFLQALINKKVLFPTALVKNIVVPLGTYFLALLLYFTPARPHALGLSFLFGWCAGGIVAGSVFFYYFRPRLRDWSPYPIPRMKLLKFSLPLASTEFFMSFAVRVDLLLLAQYAGVKIVEVYSIIVIISNSLRSLRQSFENILLAVFSKAKNNRVNRETRSIYNYVCWLILSIQIPVFFLFLFFGKELLGLISSDYAIGHRVLVIATFFIMVNTPGAFSGPLIMGLGKTLIIPVSQATFFLLSVALNYLLIPSFGAEGAAMATGFAIFIGGLICFFSSNYFADKFLIDYHYVLMLVPGVIVFLPSLLLVLSYPAGLFLKTGAFCLPALVSGIYSWHHWRRSHGAIA
jgi:O-antigen/teichoic acid export membrane protein